MWDLLKEYISKESALAEYIGIIGTLGLAILALFGDQIRKSIFKPNLQPVEIVKTHQQIGVENFLYQRLIVKNIGSSAAKGVRILLTYKKGAPQNFIHVPIAWTHWSVAARDISRHEPAYIDILRKVEGAPSYDFCWSPEVGIPYEQMLREFDPEYGNLRLEFFEQNRQIGDITLQYSKDKNELKILI